MSHNLNSELPAQYEISVSKENPLLSPISHSEIGCVMDQVFWEPLSYFCGQKSTIQGQDLTARKSMRAQIWF